METQTQDTHPQDPIDRFALHIEGMRRMSVPRGLARIVHILLVEFFVFLLCWAADIAERRRNGTLPEVAPVAAREPRAWPADLRPRESGWVEQRGAEAALGGATMQGQFEQPEINEPVVEMLAALPPRDRAGKPKVSSEPAPARPRHVDDGGGARWRGPGIVWITDVGVLRADSKKWVLAGVDTCVHFVAY